MTTTYTLIHPKTKEPYCVYRKAGDAERAAFALSRELGCGVEVRRAPVPYETQHHFLHIP